MNRNTLWRLGVLLVSLCVGLTGCAKTTTTTIPPTAIAVKRYLAGGGLDASFSGGAVATKIDPSEFEYALAVAQQTDGKIIAAGHSALSGQGVIALVRYNANGSLDSAPGSFGSGGIVRTAVGSDGAEAVAVAVQADGKIVVAGTILAANFSGKGIVLLRYNADGTLDTSFGTPGTGIVTKTIGTGSDTAAAALALQPAVLPTNVKIIVAGHALTNTKTDIVLLRYNLDGTPDLTFGGTGLVTTALSSDAAALAIQVQPADGKIVAAGPANVNFSLDTSDVALLRYSAAGALETTFGETGQNGKVVTSLGGFDNAFSIALQPDLKIVVSGNTGSAGSVTSVAVLRYNPDGKIDNTFGTGGLVTTSATGPSTIASGNAVLVQADGSIVVAGYD